MAFCPQSTGAAPTLAIALPLEPRYSYFPRLGEEYSVTPSIHFPWLLTSLPSQSLPIWNNICTERTVPFLADGGCNAQDHQPESSSRKFVVLPSPRAGLASACLLIRTNGKKPLALPIVPLALPLAQLSSSKLQISLGQSPFVEYAAVGVLGPASLKFIIVVTKV